MTEVHNYFKDPIEQVFAELSIDARDIDYQHLRRNDDYPFDSMDAVSFNVNGIPFSYTYQYDVLSFMGKDLSVSEAVYDDFKKHCYNWIQKGQFIKESI